MTAFRALSHVSSGEPFTFTYGHAQMWINMTLKCLAILDHPTVSRVYRYLHIPVDYTEAAHHTDFIGVPRPSGETPWSQLSRDQYRDYHQCLRAAITTHSSGLLAPLDWDIQARIAQKQLLTRFTH